MTETELKIMLEKFRNQPAETECVEFKEAKENYDFGKIGKYFSALSNEANLKGKDCSWLIFGIKDKPVPRQIVGSIYRSNRAYLDSLKSEVANKTTNRITFIEIHEIVYSEGRVILFQIPAAPKGIPIAWEGHYYGRDSEDLGPLNIFEVESIRKQSSQEDWSAKVVSEATIDDLDEKAILKAREEYKKKNTKKVEECDTWDNVTFLNKAKVTIQGNITNSALLLLGKEESVHFLNPAIAKISWILKDEHNKELDYEHFGPPFILNTSEIFSKIRNLTYRYIKDNSLFPTEIKMYEPYVIREALHNCIAHQDYSLKGRVTVVEKPDELIFSNLGSFIPGDVKTVIEQDSPQEYYRNAFLAEAMVNLNMIDTIGSGIKRMFEEQRNRFFPMPDYDLSDLGKVTLRISGRIWDENYTKLLISNTSLDLKTVILLDRVQKGYALEDEEIKLLRRLGLIEGRKHNLYVAASIAKVTNGKGDYIKNKAFDDDYYKQLILSFLKEYKQGKRSDFNELLFDKFSDKLNEDQKRDKVKNLLQALKVEKLINLHDDRRTWFLSKK